jgi:hypothetical protein
MEDDGAIIPSSGLSNLPILHCWRPLPQCHPYDLAPLRVSCFSIPHSLSTNSALSNCPWQEDDAFKMNKIKFKPRILNPKS